MRSFYLQGSVSSKPLRSLSTSTTMLSIKSSGPIQPSLCLRRVHQTPSITRQSFGEFIRSRLQLPQCSSEYRYPPTDEVFFVQNAGAAAAGTGLNKSAIIEKISLVEAGQIAASGNASARVNVATVDAHPTVINPNGGATCDTSDGSMLIMPAGATNYRGQLVFTGEGQGDNIAPALYLVNPVAPYNSTGMTPSGSHGDSTNKPLSSPRQQLQGTPIH